ncbi:MAG TPA: glycine zipper domain-containing protein [Dongiaceae bacterium]|jgi:hypothetical protein
MGRECARPRLLLIGMALALAVEPLAAWAQQAPIVYPAQGQTIDQQAGDESACRSFAQQQTGMYPNQAPPGYYGNPNAGAPVLGGAARGAALGAVGGAIAGDAGKGAAIGAGVGATAGLMRRNQQRRQEAAANQQAQAQYNASMNQYNQAFAACMQGRGYTVR